MSSLFELYQGSKVRLNSLLDRVIDLANAFLMSIYQLPWPWARQLVHWIARYLGDLSWLLRDFPRLNAYRMMGKNWTIIFVGGQQSLLEMQYLFFSDETITPQLFDRVDLWHLSAQSRQWLAEGVDLVVCELSRVYPGQLKAPFSLKVPSWIQQTLDLPESLDNFLVGYLMKTVRQSLNKAKKADFSWYFSRAKEDFDDFHYNMYQPFIKSRHGERALIGSYQDQWNRWFVPGGLIVIKQNDRRVAGLLCYIRDKICYAVEVGILNGDADLMRQGVKIASDWFAINWGYQQGARIYDMGGTRPWRSDGVFFYKSRWRAKVVRRSRIYGVWTFLAESLSVSLQKHLNETGFISECDGKFYATLFSTENHPVTEIELNEQLLIVENEGLDGLMIVSVDRHQVFPCCRQEKE